MTSFVHIICEVEGLHHWPDAHQPEQYLRAPHRHLFVAEVDIEVFHDDREIEFNHEARWLAGLLASLADPPTHDGPLDFGAQSCERLAARITEAVLARHGHHRHVRSVVREDGRLGGGVTWAPPPTTATGE